MRSTLPITEWNAGHGQGYDMMKAPVICPQGDVVLQEGMFLTAHPEWVQDS